MIKTKIAGIPCLIKVNHVYVKDGDCRADNPDDFYGWSEIDFDVLDRKGYPALWLDKKMTDDERYRIEELILADSASEAESWAE